MTRSITFLRRNSEYAGGALNRSSPADRLRPCCSCDATTKFLMNSSTLFFSQFWASFLFRCFIHPSTFFGSFQLPAFQISRALLVLSIAFGWLTYFYFPICFDLEDSYPRIF